MHERSTRGPGCCGTRREATTGRGVQPLPPHPIPAETASPKSRRRLGTPRRDAQFRVAADLDDAPIVRRGEMDLIRAFLARELAEIIGDDGDNPDQPERGDLRPGLDHPAG